MLILITGGTGTIGKELVKHFMDNNQIRVYSRDEFKQQQMKSWAKKNVHFFIGDVRDRDRLALAMEDVDIVIHTAALKQIDTGEYNPFEFIKTNIHGTQNVIDCAMQNNVRQVLLISSDKAVNPINLYGATKLCAEKLIKAANNYKGKRDIIFKFCRYGNVWGSRGSVLDRWEKQDPFIIRNSEATRFHITKDRALKLIEDSLDGNEVENIPLNLKAYKLKDLAGAYYAKTGKYSKHKDKLLEGEKLHESLTPTLSSNMAKRLTLDELICLVSDYLNQQ